MVILLRCCKNGEVGTTLSGAQVIPMYKVEITSSKDKVIKTYEQSGIYVLKCCI